MAKNTTDRNTPPLDDNEPELQGDDPFEESMADALDAFGTVINKPVVHKAIEAYKQKIAADHEFAKLRLEAEKEAGRARIKLHASNRNYSIAGLIIGLGVLILVMYLFREKEQVLIPIVTATIGLIGGGIGARSLSPPRS